MADKELLELAAKAAGYRYTDMLTGGLWVSVNKGKSWQIWNPLTNDGDALRLAVKLKLSIQWDGREIQVSAYEYDSANPICACECEHDALTYDEATRRAIVRAAAEIGKDMK